MKSKSYIFDVEDAIRFGVEEAIVLSNLRFWIDKNKANGKHEYDGRTWTFNSAAAFVELFPFWTEKQIRRILDSLIAQEVIVVGCYNKSKYDRTRWYSINDTIDVTKREDLTTGNGRPIPYINTDTNITSQDSNESFVDHGSQDISNTVNSSKAKKEKPNRNSAPEWIAARDRIRLLFMTNYKEWTKAKDGEEAPFPIGPKENTHIKALATRFQNYMPKFERMLKAFYRVVMTKERGWEQAAFLPSYFVFAEGRIAALVSGLSNSDIMQERNGSSNKAGMKI